MKKKSINIIKMATIQNPFNTCFLNVILQLITTTKDIMNTFKKEAYINFFNLYNKGGIISPINFINYYKTIHKDLIFGKQQDSTEPLTYILDDSDDKTPFKIDIKQIVHNKIIKNEEITYEISEKITSENMLAVPIKDDIQKSIDSLFDEVSAEKYLIGDKEIFTPRIEYQQKNSPKYLFISLKRFDPYTREKDIRSVKIGEKIQYAEYNYKLLAFVVHYGSSIGGHYVMFKIKNGKWRIYDDLLTKEVDDETIFRNKDIGYIYLFVREDFYDDVTKKELIDLTLENEIESPLNIFSSSINQQILNMKTNNQDLFKIDIQNIHCIEDSFFNREKDKETISEKEDFLTIEDFDGLKHLEQCDFDTDEEY